LVRAGKPWVIENVVGARDELMTTFMLCGTMFGLPLARHRLFETSELIMQPEHPACRGVAKRYAEERGWEYRDMSVTGKGRRAGTSERWAEIMGIDWPLTQHQLAEAIPPAYTEWIGRQLMKANLSTT
jgi:DNA (cytosine-5)-methyltransferase 1